MLYLNCILIEILSKKRSFFITFDFTLLNFFCISHSLICWYNMCEAFFLTVFINILIIDLYIWFTVAIAVRKELKLDSHTDATLTLLMPSSAWSQDQ